jgi:hypothetical protein
MLIMITLSPCELLPYAKKIMLYMCKNHEERLLNELLNELQITESFNNSLERTDTLPFYRFNQTVSMPTSASNSTSISGSSTIRKTMANMQTNENRGVLHTKRHHSGEDGLQSDHISQLTLKMRTASQNNLCTNLNEKITAELDKGSSQHLELFTCHNTLR